MAESPKSFIWYELMTSDQDAAIDFYTKVVGWTAADQKMAELDFRYTLLSAGSGPPVAGLMQISEEMAAGGARPGWIGVIGVPDVDSAAARIAESGGAILMEPTDIPNVGRFAFVADPGGAIFELLTPDDMDREAPPPSPETPGHIGWHELYAADGEEAAFAFYAAQFGWTTTDGMDMGEMGKYRIFAAGGDPIGGMMDKPAGMPAGAWQYYFTVDALDAAVDRLTSNGGTVLMGPHEVPGEIWVVQAKDPQGVHFALLSKRR